MLRLLGGPELGDALCIGFITLACLLRRPRGRRRAGDCGAGDKSGECDGGGDE
jgi:hypothetical protein